ncbi:hypothetical protein NliqN6_4942 [Naganishia liquefaciens]|uniref:ferric-chelate reductase (NADPH) n=1 Tax=Naganishia liquefaciens TaxID=104408 RepID=A0A8H3YG82_9TREE|nr:hypothetical protein NliqN6_4942 [Naganishia liquefaciens]
MYFVESTHHSHTDNTGLLPTDERFKPTSKQKNAANVGNDPWDTTPRYGYWLTYYCTSILALAILSNLFMRFLASRRARNKNDRFAKFVNKPLALARLTAYHTVPSRFLRFPRTSAVVIVLVTFAWTTAVCFAKHPYYRLTRNWGTSPLALRGEWFATALIPWTFAMAHKVSPITLLTSISHDRLQVYHQWGARVMLFFATVHTLPFIIQPLMDWQNLRSTAYAGSFMSYFYNWTGIGAYVPLFWLVFSSFAPIRNWCYEFWVVQHVATAILFLGFMYHHTQAWLYSWNYLYATTAVWLASCITRVVFTWTFTGFRPIKAEAQVLAGDIVKLDIPTRSKWLPGAHVFVRFPAINITQCHPFTIASIPDSKRAETQNTLSLLVSARAGITKSVLSKCALNGGRVSVMIDGPYGGVHSSLSRHDKVLLVGGGAGITFLIPQIFSLLEKSGHVRFVHLVWAVPSIERLECLSPLFELVSALGQLPFKLQIDVYVTRSSAQDGPEHPDVTEEKLAEKDLEAEVTLPSLTRQSRGSDQTEDASKTAKMASCRIRSYRSLYTLHSGRPDIGNTVRSFASDAQGESLAIAVCGPGQLSVSAGNACAALQLDILRGRGPAEVALHSEAFTW